MVAALIISAQITNAQIGYNTSSRYTNPGANTPVKNPNQLTNYYQNNSSYNNNSQQNNKQGNPANATTATSHGTYLDPTKFDNSNNVNYGTNANSINNGGSLNNKTLGTGTGDNLHNTPVNNSAGK